MAVAIIIVIVIAALLVIASGVWVAIGLVATLRAPKSAPLSAADRAAAGRAHDPDHTS
jgi:hypothetical protein